MKGCIRYILAGFAFAALALLSVKPLCWLMVTAGQFLER
jgi:hypothetical protein